MPAKAPVARRSVPSHAARTFAAKVAGSSARVAAHAAFSRFCDDTASLHAANTLQTAHVMEHGFLISRRNMFAHLYIMFVCAGCVETSVVASTYHIARHTMSLHTGSMHSHASRQTHSQTQLLACPEPLCHASCWVLPHHHRSTSE